MGYDMGHEHGIFVAFCFSLYEMFCILLFLFFIFHFPFCGFLAPLARSLAGVPFPGYLPGRLPVY
jgi:hypothetical protein